MQDYEFGIHIEFVISDQKDLMAMNSTNIFYIAVGSACGVILLIAFIVAVIYLRGPKPLRNERLRYLYAHKNA